MPLDIPARLKAIAGTLLFISDNLPDMQDAAGDLEGILDELYAVRDMMERGLGHERNRND
jgi:hypothetical protein